MNYTWDLAGNLTSYSNGVWPQYNQSFNLAGRLTTLTSSYVDSQHPATLFSNASYNGFGELLTATLGNGLAETRTYNARGWLATIGDGSAYTLTVPSANGYAGNGNILAANDSVNGNWSYTYDDFNRLSTAAKNGVGTYSWAYDRFGNRWQQNLNGSAQWNQTFSGGNNRMDGWSYDAAGNLRNDGIHSYSYDAENRLISVDGGPTAS